MFLYHPFRHDSRVLKQARTLVEAGHEVRVIAALDEATAREEEREGFRITRVDRDPLPTKILRRLVRARGTGAAAPAGAAPPPLVSATRDGPILRLARRSHIAWDHLKFSREAFLAAREEPADVYVAHDLETLPIAVWAKRRLGGRVLYDSHELFVERTFTVPPQTRLWKPRWALIERLLIRRADQVVTVCQPIAAELARRYRVPEPAVVLNVPDVARAAGQDRDLRATLGIAPQTPLVLYLGGLLPFRGIEPAIRALVLLDDAHLALLGPTSPDYLASVHALAADMGVADRVHTPGPVPSDEVVACARSADVGLCLIENVGLSYYHSLPNKLFEYLAAGVPVVASDFPTMRTVVDEANAGFTCDPTDHEAIAAAVRAILASPTRYAPVGSSYTWEREGARYLALVEALGTE
jgi:glycosyltransferase involved in cell wall biosynthesis